MNPSRPVIGDNGLCVMTALAGACDRSLLVVRNVNLWSPDGIQRGRDVYVTAGRVQSIRPSRRAGAIGGDVRVIVGLPPP